MAIFNIYKKIQGSNDLGNAPFIEMYLCRDSNYDSVAVANAVELETPSAKSPPTHWTARHQVADVGVIFVTAHIMH